MMLQEFHANPENVRNYTYVIINIYILYLVPVAPPNNVNATSYTPTSITVCFEFPEGSTQNGLITSFNVTLVGSPFDTESQTISIDVTTSNYPLIGSICSDVTNLQEYNYYLIRVMMINSVGPGPSSPSIGVRSMQAVSTEPLNLISDSIDATFFCVSFNPPTNITQNGLITSYTVTYQGELFNTTEYNTTVSVNTVVYPLTESSSVCISDLEEYNNYTVLIRANNGAGQGAAAIITIRTSEAGSFKY